MDGSSSLLIKRSGEHINISVAILAQQKFFFRDKWLQSCRLGSSQHLFELRAAFPACNQQDPAPMEKKEEEHLNI